MSALLVLALAVALLSAVLSVVLLALVFGLAIFWYGQDIPKKQKSDSTLLFPRHRQGPRQRPRQGITSPREQQPNNIVF